MVTTPKKPTTAAERAAHVREANANAAIEGFHPDEEDKAMQARYIAGTASIADLLALAKKAADAGKKGGSS